MKFWLLLAIFCVSTAKADLGYQGALQKFATLNAEEIATVTEAKHHSHLRLHGQKTRYSVLMMQGLFESPNYTKGLNDFFYSQGWNVVSILSRGHWRKGDPRMQNARFEDWRKDADLGLEIAEGLGDKVLVFGYSTGGLMATDVALRYPNRVAGLFLFAPALALATETQLTVSFGATFRIFAREICDPKIMEGFCKVLKWGYEGLPASIQEGLALSPLGGDQVKNFIQQIYLESEKTTQWYDSRGVERGKYLVLLDVYSRLQVPVFMVLDEGDMLVSTHFNKLVYRYLPQPKNLIYYPKKLKIDHHRIAKSSKDAFTATPNNYNYLFQELTEQMSQFIQKTW